MADPSPELFRREAIEHSRRSSTEGSVLQLPPSDRRARRRRAVPYVQQLTVTDCGAASLAMALGYFGKPVPLAEIRNVLGAGRDGTTARDLLEAGARFGLVGRGIRLELDDDRDLAYLEPGTILHWEMNHFVVYAGLRRGGVDVVDPASGRRRIPLPSFRRSFTGIALVFEPSESFTAEASRSGRLGRHLLPFLRGVTLWPKVIAISLVMQAVTLALPLLTGIIVDRVVPRSERGLLGVIAAALAAVVLMQLGLSLLRGHLLLRLRTLLDAAMSRRFLEHLVSLPFAFFQLRPTGDLLMRLNSNATIREILTGAVVSGLLDGLLTTGYLAVLFATSPLFGALVLAFAAAQAAVLLATRRVQQDRLAEVLSAQARSEGAGIEIVEGIETLKVAGVEARALERWNTLFTEVLNRSLARGRVEVAVDAASNALRVAAPLVLLVAGAELVLSGGLTLGEMLALSALATGVLVPLSGVLDVASRLQLLGRYVARIEDVLDFPPEFDAEKVQPAPGLAGAVSLQDVSFRYAPIAPLAVDGVSLDVAAGQRVAIVGRSGSGKSTLAGLLVALHRPSEGRILFDGIDLATLDARSVRRQLGVVMQQPSFFADSIRANIELGAPGAGLDEIIAAARLACIHDEIAAMPLGYETVLADRGASLSGGQRQRLALARALLRRPKLLLLDEATSALDAITEAAIHRNLAELRCTQIVIAHRLATVAAADQIFVLEGGRLVERGTHAELLARAGPYAALVASQLQPGEGVPAAAATGAARR